MCWWYSGTILQMVGLKLIFLNSTFNIFFLIDKILSKFIFFHCRLLDVTIRWNNSLNLPIPSQENSGKMCTSLQTLATTGVSKIVRLLQSQNIFQAVLVFASP